MMEVSILRSGFQPVETGHRNRLTYLMRSPQMHSDDVGEPSRFAPFLKSAKRDASPTLPSKRQRTCGSVRAKVA